MIGLPSLGQLDRSAGTTRIWLATAPADMRCGFDRLVDAELARIGHLFNRAYSDRGRPGVPPETLLKAMPLQALYAIRSEAQLVERIDTDLLFRWFLDMDPAVEVVDPSRGGRARPWRAGRARAAPTHPNAASLFRPCYQGGAPLTALPSAREPQFSFVVPLIMLDARRPRYTRARRGPRA